MNKNKYTALWTSSSSISSFKNCKRAYFLGNVYKTERNKKIAMVAPHFSLGTVVHNVLEPLAKLPSEERAVKMLAPDFHREWAKVSGEIGGFTSVEQEKEYKEKAKDILRNVKANIHHLLGETAFLDTKEDLPWMWLSEEHEIVLCGQTDFILKKDTKDYHVIDFKTGKTIQKEDSLQLPIYRILLSNFLGESDFSASYWYIQYEADPTPKEIPSLQESKEKVLAVALEMKEARARGIFECEHGGCFHCEGYEKILRSECKLVGYGRFGNELYLLDK